jgi:uncharacterized protein (DUF1778 family)
METHDTAHEAEPKTARETRLNLRTTARQDTLIRLAAQASSKTVTDFVLDSASIAAEQVLADRRWFMLDESSWAAFQDLLERPAVIKPRLAALLSKESDLFEDLKSRTIHGPVLKTPQTRPARRCR